MNQKSVRASVAHAIQQLVGLPLWSIGRSGSLEWFHFGERPLVRRPLTDSEFEAGELALHLDCEWRLVNEHGHILANQYSNVEILDGLASAGLVCQTAIAGDAGDFRLVFASKSSLIVEDNNPNCDEWWRLFRPGAGSPHFVVGPAGLLG